MLSLVASAVLAGAAFSQENELIRDVATRAGQSVVVLETVSGPVGVAVLIDTEGYFLTQNYTTDQTPLYGVFPDGERVPLQYIASDSITNLALLHALRPTVGKTPMRLSASDPQEGDLLVAFTLSGFQPSQLASRDRVGLIRPSLSYVPLQEFRLELPSTALGSALVFNDAGELVGLIGASLSLEQEETPARAMGGVATAGSGISRGDLGAAYGPQEMVTAFSLGHVALSRVIDGLLSDDRKVEHPSIGVFFKTSTLGGALIEELLSNGAGMEAGLRLGDRIVSVDGRAVRDAFQLAASLFNLTVGETTFIGVVRNGETMEFEVEVRQRRTASHEQSPLDSLSLDSDRSQA